jgi:murein tripeptide amidase MpaA
MYRTVAQLDSLTNSLATQFPGTFTRVQLPEASVGGSPVFALRMRAGDLEDRRGVLLVGGTHSRELMNPDAIVELAVDLLVSYLNGADLVYGGRSWPANDVKFTLEALDIWMVPCSNPDGRTYVINVDDLWRKNRRDNAGTSCDGVDLNRNLDFMWGVTQGQTSCNPCSDVYCGPDAFSEPETRNIKNLLDAHRINTFADVHSFSELILYPWGHAPTQTNDPSKVFTNLPTGTCSTIATQGYAEYMEPQDLDRFQTVGDRIVDDIAAVQGRVYTNEPSLGLYATTGTHSDYAYSRHIADPSLQKTYGYTFETGPSVGDAAESFHPADPEPVKRDAKAGMYSLIQQSVCAIELIGWSLLKRDDEIVSLRRVRDDFLATTEAGRAWISLFERSQLELIGPAFADEKLAAEAADLLQSAGRMLQEEKAVIGSAEIERAQALIKRLAGKARTDQLRSDLELVSSELGRLEGLSNAEAIRTLMSRSPEGKPAGE